MLRTQLAKYSQDISFSPKELVSFNFVAAVTKCSDFEAQKIKSDTVSTVSPSISHEVVQGPCYPGQKWRGTLTLLPQSEIRSSPIAPVPVKFRADYDHAAV